MYRETINLPQLSNARSCCFYRRLQLAEYRQPPKKLRMIAATMPLVGVSILNIVAFAFQRNFIATEKWHKSQLFQIIRWNLTIHDAAITFP